MQNKHEVYCFLNYLFFLPEGNKAYSSKPYQILSTNTRLISEEIQAFIKEETQKNFLHISDFNLYFICEKLLTLPSSVFEPQLMNDYWKRMHEPQTKENELEVFVNKHYKLHLIYELHPGWRTFIGHHFNLKTSPLYMDEILQPPSHDALALELLILPSHFLMCFKTQYSLLFLDLSVYDAVDDILYFVLNVYKKQAANLVMNTLQIHAFCSRIVSENFVRDFKKIKDFSNVLITERIKPYQ